MKPTEEEAAQEAAHLREALDRAGGDTVLAAWQLGLSKRTLLRRMNEYGIPTRRGRPRVKMRYALPPSDDS